MLRAYGQDRCREVQGRRILHSRIPKGWTPRTPATLVHAEFPGTAVLWDDEYFEVVDATPLDHGGVRYVLLPWRDDHIIRIFEAYDAESESRRLADYALAQSQRKSSVAARWSGVLLGHLPSAVQEDLQNRLGVSPGRMTLISAVPPLVLLGICVYLSVGAFMGQNTIRIPIVLFFLVAGMGAESIIRMTIALSTTRGVGSFAGWVAYLAWWLATGRRGVAPTGARGERVRFTPPPPDVEARDTLEVLDPLLTLLPVAEQERLARDRGYDYRRHAVGVAAVVLIFATAGLWTAYSRVESTGSPFAVISALLASYVVLEQLVRLHRLRARPAGSILGILVRLLAGRALRLLS